MNEADILVKVRDASLNKPSQRAKIETEVERAREKTIAITTSPIWHFTREHCQKCPYFETCDANQQLRCVLARIALDLHSLTRNELQTGRCHNR